MPYRYAHHLILLLLVPAIAVAFWPHYFGVLTTASFAFHAHGLTASAWILLVAAQSWTIHRRRFHLHRVLGRAVFGLVPLFAGGGALAMRSMAIKYLARSDPFYTALGPMLGLDDLLTTVALVAFVRTALVHRRRAAIHGGWLLATTLLVLPPVMSRLNLPPALHAGEAIAAVVAVTVMVIQPQGRRPFGVLLVVLAARAGAIALFGFSPAWRTVFVALPGVWPPLLALTAIVAAFAALWSAWQPAWWWRPAPVRAARATGS